ncbi:hypothetical protein [Mycetocola spongiae]|uniref:hypothetical protein n=1 Tax=Mycetocola spongiae TaxID=2859226 RepID=UPI001CF36A41|nr:hypothetical protein [Mycetocola spongiae]UCR88050.1 hypothetical protein KXZ72_08530 [Mycetocola spongiae]
MTPTATATDRSLAATLNWVGLGAWALLLVGGVLFLLGMSPVEAGYFASDPLHENPFAGALLGPTSWAGLGLASLGLLGLGFWMGARVLGRAR